MIDPLPVYPVKSAQGIYIKLSTGEILIDGMSSWWSAIWGYNNKRLNFVVKNQLKRMSHIMFGGFTHKPAIELAKLLIKISPKCLRKVFFSDSGSVSVEVAMKIALQYWYSLKNKNKKKFLTIKNSYHGDTFNAMSVCDPITGMHKIFRNILPKNYFAPSPNCKFNDLWNPKDILKLEEIIKKKHEKIAAVIIEPIVQGAGGMKFYNQMFLTETRKLCTKYNILLIIDEIATGFGRTGKIFACEHSKISPDILCVGKALTGGYMTLAATLTTNNIANTISQNYPFIFMHGPTFMANPLACSVAIESINLLLEFPLKKRINEIENILKKELLICKDNPNVSDVRVLGAIAVIEMRKDIDIKKTIELFVRNGVWVRPFKNLLYIMPPYIINNSQLKKLTKTLVFISGMGEKILIN